ncbi:MAG: YkvA family protein [Phascolarctobacterium sp.]|nr:YkvA family protein [Phascolarctobacterium sp.]
MYNNKTNLPTDENIQYETHRIPESNQDGPSFIAKLAVAAIVVAYLGSPIDVIPDFIPVLGQVDDITAIYLAYRYIFLSGKE